MYMASCLVGTCTVNLLCQEENTYLLQKHCGSTVVSERPTEARKAKGQASSIMNAAMKRRMGNSVTVISAICLLEKKKRVQCINKVHITMTATELSVDAIRLRLTNAKTLDFYNLVLSARCLKLSRDSVGVDLQLITV